MIGAGVSGSELQNRNIGDQDCCVSLRDARNDDF